MTVAEKVFERWKELVALAATGPDTKTFKRLHDEVANRWRDLSLEDQGEVTAMVVAFWEAK